MASPFDLSRSGDPTDNMVESKITLKRSINIAENENESSKKLATKVVMNVESALPFDDTSRKVNVDDLKTLELKVHEYDDGKGNNENVDKSNRSSEKITMDEKIIKTFHPLVEDHNNINLNEPETPNKPKVHEEDDNIDGGVNLENLIESVEDVTDVKTLHPPDREDSNMKMDNLIAPFEQEVDEDDGEIDSAKYVEKLSKSSEEITMEDEMKFKKSDEGNSNLIEDEQKLNEVNEMESVDEDENLIELDEDDEMEITEDDEMDIYEDDEMGNDEDDEMEYNDDDEMESDEEYEMEDNEDDEMEYDGMDETDSDENPEQTENDHISINSSSSSSSNEEESSKIDSDEENETPENRIAREEFRRKRREHYNEEYRVARLLVNQMRDINEESSEDEVVVISDSNDENDESNLSNTV